MDDFFRSFGEMAEEVGRVRLIVAPTPVDFRDSRSPVAPSSSTARNTHISRSLFVPIDVLTVDFLGFVIEIIAVVVDMLL